ncbi:MAG: metallophosphoesterase family protein [Cellulosilyticaceae bacterium]
MRYVISDLHGHYALFREMLELIHFKEEDTLYILGDMIDRGSDPIPTVQYIMKQPNMKVLMGNHELLMLGTINDLEDETARGAWYRNGGEITHQQFDALSIEEQQAMKVYLQSLPTTIEVNQYLLVHAGVRVPQAGCLWGDVKDEQTVRDLTFIRGEFIENTALKDKIVIFGHTQTKGFATPGEIYFGKDKIGIDCGVYSRKSGGKLGCLNLDTLETYYL